RTSKDPWRKRKIVSLSKVGRPRRSFDPLSRCSVMNQNTSCIIRVARLTPTFHVKIIRPATLPAHLQTGNLYGLVLVILESNRFSLCETRSEERRVGKGCRSRV